MKKTITFKDIDAARKLLGLSEITSIDEIKNSYRKLVLKYHPDKHENDKEYDEKIKDINFAYMIIIDYCQKYPITFTPNKIKEVEEGAYEEDILKRFYDGWI